MARPELAFLAVRSFSAAGYFLLVPFFALWLIDYRGFSGPAAATVVAFCLFFGRAGGMLAARFLNWMGLRYSVFVAYAIATITLAIMAIYKGESLFIWNVIGSLFGLSFSAATAALKAMVAVSYTPKQLLRAFSMLNLAVNAGAAAGVAAGGFLVADAPNVFVWGSAALYGAAFLALLFVPATTKTEKRSSADTTATGSPMAFGFFLLFTGITWVAYAQVFNVLPTLSAETIGSKAISYLFILNSAMVIVLQAPITAAIEWFRKRNAQMAALTVLPAAHLVLAASVLMFGFTGHSPVVLAYIAMILFTLTELIWGPTYDSEILNVKGHLSSVTAYGIAGALRGGAESLGSWVGIAAVTSSVALWPTDALSFWISSSALVAVAVYFLWLGIRQSGLKPLHG
ncbi:MFS transporter [Corynebacterium sp.]|uniref:MFS transporter n=1 Tax=Corynebacterium sp. TaxID=1720 RepID=UPI0026DC3F22|nr:MFS transporter [Corynebacterium sp.]MDO5076687.1 hypothetical protein [Corynebacterium sp.]